MLLSEHYFLHSAQHTAFTFLCNGPGRTLTTFRICPALDENSLEGRNTCHIAQCSPAAPLQSLKLSLYEMALTIYVHFVTLQLGQRGQTATLLEATIPLSQTHAAGSACILSGRNGCFHHGVVHQESGHRNWKRSTLCATLLEPSSGKHKKTRGGRRLQRSVCASHSKRTATWPQVLCTAWSYLCPHRKCPLNSILKPGEVSGH